LLKERTSEAWKLEFLSQKERQKQRAGNYFSKYEWLLNFKIQTKCKRPVSSAFYMLKIGHRYLKTYLKQIGKTASDLCYCRA